MAPCLPRRQPIRSDVVGQGRGAHQGVDLGCEWGLSGKTNGSAPTTTTTTFKLDAFAVFVVTAFVTQTPHLSDTDGGVATSDHLREVDEGASKLSCET